VSVKHYSKDYPAFQLILSVEYLIYYAPGPWLNLWPLSILFFINIWLHYFYLTWKRS